MPIKLPKTPIQKIMRFAALALLILSVATWFMTREPLPKVITIASGVEGGLYHQFAEDYTTALRKHSDRSVVIRNTNGSLENQRLLIDGEVDLAIIQIDSSFDKNIAILTPLFREAVLIIVRNNQGIKSITDLNDKIISIGPMGSGMQVPATEVLNHYEVIAAEIRFDHFTSLADDHSLDAAVVTSGVSSQHLRELLYSKQYDLLEINNTDAVMTWRPWYKRYTIPRGLYSEQPAIPGKALATIETTAVLAVRQDSYDSLIETSLEALYDDPLYSSIMNSQPVLMSKADANSWDILPKHRTARAYFRPYEGLDDLSSFLESLAAIKELLVAFFAGLYLLWNRARRNNER